MGLHSTCGGAGGVWGYSRIRDLERRDDQVGMVGKAEESEETHDVIAPPCLGRRAQYQEYGTRPLCPESHGWHLRRRQPPRMVVSSDG